MKNVSHLSCVAIEVLKSDELLPLLISDGTQIDDHEHLENLENAVELIVCTEEQMHKLSIHFDKKNIYISKTSFIF